MTIDPMIRTELTGPWAGFGFQRGHLWTPEGHTLYPDQMIWMSLTCNIAREWRQLMQDARSSERRPIPSGSVIYLRDVLREQQERVCSEPAQAGQQ